MYDRIRVRNKPTMNWKGLLTRAPKGGRWLQTGVKFTGQGSNMKEVQGVELMTKH